MLGKTLNRRYQLEQLLGKGDLGSLYLATEVASGEMLAVKVFRPDIGLQGEEGLRYLRLMRRLAPLNHPHLLVPRETAYAEGHAYQVLPFYPAPSLQQELSGEPFPLAQGVALLQQIAAALAELHRAGVAHHNLKPANILVSREDGRLEAVVTDAARGLLAGDAFPHGGSEAAAYRAPEEPPWLETAPDERADLYALGVIGYRVLAGRLPFEAASAHELLARHLAEPPPPPRELNALIPPRLAALLVKLLAKRPAERYQSAQGLLADLEDWERGESLALGRRDVPRAFDWGRSMPGSEPAHEAALAALARATSGRGTLLVWNGGPGADARRWFETLLPRIESVRALVLRVHTPPAGWCPPLHLPLGLLGDLLQRWELLPDLSRRDLLFRLHSALGENAGLLTALDPPLRTLLPQEGMPAPLPAEREPARLLHLLGSALLALGQPGRPLVLWLGDLEGADPDSLAWLERLAARLAAAPVLAVGAFAPDRAPAGHPLLHDQPARAAPAGSSLRIDLPPLDARRSALLAEITLGGAARARAEGPPLARLGAWLHGRWGGHALAQEMALRLLTARGLIAPAPAGEAGAEERRCAWTEIEAASWPETPAGLVEARLELLPDGVRVALEAAAVFPGPIPFDALAAVLDHLPREALLELVEQAIAEGILRRGRHGLEFTQAPLREALHRLLPPARSETYHRTLAAQMEERPQGAPLQHAHETALHFRAGGDGERHIAHGLAAAEEAFRHHVTHAALGWFRTVLPALPALASDGRRPALLAKLGTVLAVAGPPAEALETLEAARQATADPGEAARLLHRKAWVLAEQGLRPEAAALIEQGLALLGEALPGNAVGAAVARLAAGAGRRYGDLLAIAAGAPQPLPGEPERRLAALLELAAEVLLPGQPYRALLADEKALRLHAGRLPTPALARALIRLAEAEGDPRGALFRQAEALLRSQPFPYERAALPAARARAHLRRLELGEARAQAGQALDAFRDLGDLRGEAAVLCTLAELDRLQGPAAALGLRADALRALGRLASGAGLGEWGRVYAAYGDALLGRLRAGEAAAALRALAGRFDALQVPGAAHLALALAGELSLAEGEAAAAQEVLRGGEEALAHPFGAERALHEATLAEARLVLAREYPQEAEFHLGQARRLLQGLRAARKRMARVAPEVTRLDTMLHLLEGQVSPALRLAEAGLQALEAEGARVPAALLCHRVAEGLKALGEPAWLRWGGQALTRFDALGAALYVGATRRLLEMEAPEPAAGGAADPLADVVARLGAPDLRAADPGARAEGAPGPGALAGPSNGTLLTLLEALVAEPEATLPAVRRTVLRACFEAAEAAFGALFVAGADGLPALAEQVGTVAGSALAGGDDGGGEVAYNRWLVETVWRSGRGQTLDNYQPPLGDDARGAYLSEPQSLLCIPLAGPGGTQGVVYLGSAMNRHIFDRTHLERLTALGREAAAILAAVRAVTASRHARAGLDAEAQRARDLVAWATHAAHRGSVGGILAAYLDEAAGLGCVGAAVYWHDAAARCLRPGARVPHGVLAPGSLAAGRGAPGVRAGDARPLAAPSAGWLAALEQRPIALQAGAGTPAAEDELALLASLGGAAGQWLPFVAAGETLGAVLLAFRPGPDGAGAPSAGADLEGLVLRLRALSPALHLARQREALAAERGGLLERLRALEARQGVYARLLPHHLRGGEEALPSAPDGGEEVYGPVLAGRLYGASLVMRLGRGEALRTLRRYYQEVERALALHQGRLEHFSAEQWIARFERGAESAAWCALTLRQLLEGESDGAGDEGLALLATGLGLHWGTRVSVLVAAGDRAAALTLGDGPQVALRLAGLGRSLRAGILASEDLAQQLDGGAGFGMRSLGTFRLEAGERRVGVFELQPALAEPLRLRVEEQQPLWDRAIRRYRLGRWQEAGALFREYVERLPDDRVARQFLRSCRQRAQGAAD